MTKIQLRCHWTKIFVFAFLVIATLLVGCGAKEPLPQPEFPLSVDALTAALEEVGLSWSIDSEQTQNTSTETMISTIYSLHRPEDRSGYNGVFINSYNSDDFGRRLQIYFHEPQNKQWWQETEDDSCWEDWRTALVLVARLYGGFEDAEAIYRACSVVELPKDDYILWQGPLTGGYFLMTTSNLMRPERFSMGNTVSLNVYESEKAYLRFRQMAEDAKEESAAQQGETHKPDDIVEKKAHP